MTLCMRHSIPNRHLDPFWESRILRFSLEAQSNKTPDIKEVASTPSPELLKQALTPEAVKKQVEHEKGKTKDQVADLQRQQTEKDARLGSIADATSSEKKNEKNERLNYEEKMRVLTMGINHSKKLYDFIGKQSTNIRTAEETKKSGGFFYALGVTLYGKRSDALGQDIADCRDKIKVAQWLLSLMAVTKDPAAGRTKILANFNAVRSRLALTRLNSDFTESNQVESGPRLEKFDGSDYAIKREASETASIASGEITAFLFNVATLGAGAITKAAPTAAALVESQAAARGITTAVVKAELFSAAEKIGGEFLQNQVVAMFANKNIS